MGEYNYIKWFSETGKEDTNIVGSKGANLGELTQRGLKIPPGFSITTKSYIEFIDENELDEIIRALMYGLDEENLETLKHVSSQIRKRIIESVIPSKLKQEIINAYKEFSKEINLQNPEVAIRSSGIFEDLPKASFAGQQDTYLHIRGQEELLRHIKMCWASLWTSRAIYYRVKQNFDHFNSSMSVVIQVMVNSEKSGVILTGNPINNNLDEMIINSSWGLGQAITSGLVTPDEYIIRKDKKQILNKFISDKNIMVVKDEEQIGTIEVRVKDFLGKDKVKEESLNDEELRKLINCGIKIEGIYGSSQNIEWGFDNDTKDLYILQSRPITNLLVKKDQEELGNDFKILAKGITACPGFGMGRVRNIRDRSGMDLVEEGDIIIATMTNPDMIPAMRRAAAIVTDEGGTTCHAAIVSRELQIPCIVGSRNGSTILKDGMEISVDATKGIVYNGYIKEKLTNN